MDYHSQPGTSAETSIFREPTLSTLAAAKQVGFGQQQLSESVATHLREQIISGKLAKGSFLRIDAIAKELNISTTPVREGLLLLQSESFVRLMPRRGFMVNSFSKEDVLDLFWAQAIIAAELAARATKRISKEELAHLQELHDAHEVAVREKDVPLAARLGHHYHRTINLAAQSPRLALLMGSLSKQLPNRFYSSIEGQLEGAVEYHPMIISALRMGDPEAARSLMFRHVLSGAEHLISMLERQGLWTSGETAPAVAAAPSPDPATPTRGRRRKAA
ncbi:MAG: GntR family transcriptional regulator [Rhodoferax sp.]|nr:GntR family transcriptional regulator [Rhodoferax sp.]